MKISDQQFLDLLRGIMHVMKLLQQQVESVSRVSTWNNKAIALLANLREDQPELGAAVETARKEIEELERLFKLSQSDQAGEPDTAAGDTGPSASPGV